MIQSLEQKKEYFDKIISLCALGESSSEIARVMNELGLEELTSFHIDDFKRAYKKQIADYAVEYAHDILHASKRSSKTFRIAELDSILEKIREAVDEKLGVSAAQAAKLMEVYLRGLRLLAEECGDISSSKGTENKYVILLQTAPPEKKSQIVYHLRELEKAMMETKALPEYDDTIDAEFDAEDTSG